MVWGVTFELCPLALRYLDPQCLLIKKTRLHTVPQEC
jgi:hypothetical protein